MKKPSRLAIWKSALPAVALLAATFTAPAGAATVTFNLGTVFSDGSVAPDGTAPYATVTLDDAGTGQVEMTVDISGDVGKAYMKELYLNFDSTLTLDLSLLTFTYGGSSTGPAADNPVSVGTDAFQSDGDGAYDILFKFPKKGKKRFGAGETVIYTITSSDAITAQSFNILSAEGGGEGTFLAASKFNATGPSQKNSAWVGASVIPVPASVIPVPAAVWLFGSGLLGLIGVARRKKA